ncbi:MAG: NADPH-dependent FMN reductase [Halobacteriaceae archaeon]
MTGSDGPLVVGVCGSRRATSTTRVAVRQALSAAADLGAETDFIDLGAVDLPLYHPDRDTQGESAELRRRFRRGDGAIIGSPVYHGSYSSTWRNFHDYCSFDDFEDTAVGLVATAGGGSYGSTLEHMRSTVRGVHGWVAPRQVGVRNASSKIVEGEVVDEAIEDRLIDLGEQVARHAAQLNTRQLTNAAEPEP